MATVSPLQVQNLNHSFGPSDILKDINFGLQRGEVVSVVGPSGSGKTTLLHLCANLLEVTDGRVDNRFSRTACAFQDARLLPWQTALDNIAFGLKALGVDRKTRHQQAQEMGLRLGLDASDLEKFPKALSGGMRQRVAFARALVIAPELLFLDEPFSALDIGLKRELQLLLVEKVQQEHLSILFITHDLMEAVRLSHRILLLGGEPGQIVAEFPLDTALEARDDAYVYQRTASLLNDTHILTTFELSLGSRHAQ